MGAAIQLRRERFTRAEHLRAWQTLCDDPSLAGIAYQIETDAWGTVQMSPTRTKHSRMVRRVARLLEEKLGGEALTELAIVTEDGVKVPDVAWCSEAFLAQHWSEIAFQCRVRTACEDRAVSQLRCSGGMACCRRRNRRDLHATRSTRELKFRT
jgi:hypothetical protein